MTLIALPCPQCDGIATDLSEHLQVVHSVEKKVANRAVLVRLLSDCDRKKKFVKCKICNLTLINKNAVFYHHIEHFHNYSIGEAVKILHDKDSTEQEQRNNGFTSVAGQCGYCETILGEYRPPELPLEISSYSIQSVDYDIEHGSYAVTPGKNQGAFNRKFKNHLQNCRYKAEFPEVVALKSTKRKRSTMNNDNNNSITSVEVTISRPKRQRKKPERFTNA